jgi:hypothetical protein
MRGTATTFSPGRLPGRQFAEPEMATPVQAQQAHNRGMANLATAAADRRGMTDPRIEAQYGGFRAPGQTIEEVKAAKEGPGATQERLMKGELFHAQQEKLAREEDKARRDEAVATFSKIALRRYGTFDKTGKAVLPTDEHLLRDINEAQEYAREQGNHQAGMSYMEWSKRLREMYPDVYAATMRENPMAWRDVVVTHGPQLEKVGPTTTPPATRGFTETDKFFGGQSPFAVGP